MDESGELNRLVRELNEGRGLEPADPEATALLDQWLETLVSKGGSDLLLVENAPPCMRVQGEIRKIEANTLNGGDIEAAVLPALSRHALKVYREVSIADASYRIEGVGRFRINLHRERGRAAAIRALPTRVPALPELHLPAAVANLAGFLTSFQVSWTSDAAIQLQARLRFLAFTGQFVTREYDPLGFGTAVGEAAGS